MCNILNECVYWVQIRNDSLFKMVMCLKLESSRVLDERIDAMLNVCILLDHGLHVLLTRLKLVFLHPFQVMMYMSSSLVQLSIAVVETFCDMTKPSVV